MSLAATAKGLALLCLLLIILIILQGCVSAPMAPCDACIGPYDVGLSSHREALGLKP